MDMTSGHKLYTLEEFASFIQVSPHTIRRWISRGKLEPTICVGAIKRFDLTDALCQIKNMARPDRKSAFKPKPQASPDEAKD